MHKRMGVRNPKKLEKHKRGNVKKQQFLYSCQTYMRGAYNVCRAGVGFVAGAGPPLKS